MSTIRQLLNQKGGKVCSIGPDATVFDAVAKMAENDIGSKHSSASSPRGITHAMLCSRGKSSSTTAISEIMDRRVITIRPEQSVEECMALMTERRVRHLPVVEGEKNKKLSGNAPAGVKE